LKHLSELILTDTRLKPIADKVLSSERLSFEDGINLYRSATCLPSAGWPIMFAKNTAMSPTSTSIATSIPPTFV
jgi:hypothetical protein